MGQLWMMETAMEEIDELIDFIPYSIGIEIPDIITVILIVIYFIIIKNFGKQITEFLTKQLKGKGGEK